jgi:hypothetical protein
LKTAKYILLIACLLVLGCKRVPTYDIGAPKGDTLKENMINANRIIAQSEEQQIAAWVARRGVQMQRLPSGVRVMESGRGVPPCTPASGERRINYEDTVAVSYRVSTLGGEEVYGWRDDTVVVGRLKPTRGLDAALRTLQRGSEALVLVPSEQGYGLVGDGDRIRTRMVLVYEVRVER